MCVRRCAGDVWEVWDCSGFSHHQLGGQLASRAVFCKLQAIKNCQWGQAAWEQGQAYTEYSYY